MGWLDDLETTPEADWNRDNGAFLLPEGITTVDGERSSWVVGGFTDPVVRGMSRPCPACNAPGRWLDHLNPATSDYECPAA